MKIVYSLVLALTLVFATACTKDQICDKAKSAAVLVAGEVATQLSCKNASAIQADMEALLVKAKLCEAAAAPSISALGPIGDIICKPVIDALVAGLVTQIPAKYECSGDGKLTDELKAKLVAACAKAI